MGTVIKNNICKGEDMHLDKDGYYRTTKWVNGKAKTYQVHRLIWAEANGEIPEGMQIHHINANKQDNRLENLSLVTGQQNKQKMDRAGKGYKVDKRLKTRPYEAQRKLNGKHYSLGNFGTICGAVMASRMFFVNLNT